jgi:hypothetical protein
MQALLFQRRKNTCLRGVWCPLNASIVGAEGDRAPFGAGDLVEIATPFAIGHFRVRNYIRGKVGRVEVMIAPGMPRD